METRNEFNERTSMSSQYEMLHNQISPDSYQRFMPHGDNFQDIPAQDSMQYIAERQGANRITNYQSQPAGHYSSATSLQSESPYTRNNGIRSRAALSSTQPSSIASPNEPLSRTDAQSNVTTPATPFRDPTVFVAPHLLRQPDPSPSNLHIWRRRFFNIAEPLLLTEDQYLTYFPHVDNVYSHRSTQKYKRKPFVSHYWDCRLKGRPTGTPLRKHAADDGEEPERKKRKRKVRERDLCDVKIKVTEYFSAQEIEHLRSLGLGLQANASSVADGIGEISFAVGKAAEGFSVLEPAEEYPPDHPGANGRKWYMVQRVIGNEKEGEEVGDRDLDHKHTLEESDRVKKNTVQRSLLAKEKDKKKANKDAPTVDAVQTEYIKPIDTQPRYYASGSALQTLFSHIDEANTGLTFFGSSSCPFSQRVWIALEHIGIPYRYVDVTERDFTRPLNASEDAPFILNIPELKAHNPDGKIPCLLHNNFAVWETSAMLEYLEDLALGPSLFPTSTCTPQLKAHSRIWCDFINRRILPYFYALLVMPDNAARDAAGGVDCDDSVNIARSNQRRTGIFNDEVYEVPSTNKYFVTDKSTPGTEDMVGQQSAKISDLLNTLLTNITTLVNASHRTGPYFMGDSLSFLDMAFAPWIIRLSRVLTYYRGFPRPEVGTRWQTWCDAVENDHVVRRTVSEEESYRAIYAAASWQTAEDGSLTTHWAYDKHGRIRSNYAQAQRNNFPEIHAAQRLIDAEGIVWGW